MHNITPEEGAEAARKAEKTIQELLDQNGLTFLFLVDKLKAELEACETKTFCNRGNIVMSEPLIAWDVRQKARIDAHKLRGDYPAEKQEVTVHGDIADRLQKALDAKKDL